MTMEDSKHVSHASTGKKLWIIWVFGLGFFAGFLVCLVVADRLKNGSPSSRTSEVEPALPVSKPEPVAEKEPEHVPTATTEQESVHSVTMSKATRDRLLSFDFLKLMQDAEIHRYRFEGETRGIVLKKIRTGSVYEKIGFQDGDVIEAINGIAFADIGKRKKEMTDTLPGANSLEFKVLRDERYQIIRVKITDAPDAGEH